MKRVITASLAALLLSACATAKPAGTGETGEGSADERPEDLPNGCQMAGAELGNEKACERKKP